MKATILHAFWGHWARTALGVLGSVAAVAPGNLPSEATAWLSQLLPGVPGWLCRALGIAIVLWRMEQGRRVTKAVRIDNAGVS